MPLKRTRSGRAAPRSSPKRMGFQIFSSLMVLKGIVLRLPNSGGQPITTLVANVPDFAKIEGALPHSTVETAYKMHGCSSANHRTISTLQFIEQSVHGRPNTLWNFIQRPWSCSLGTTRQIQTEALPIAQLPCTATDHKALWRDCYLDLSRVTTFLPRELEAAQDQGPISNALRARVCTMAFEGISTLPSRYVDLILLNICR
ncbi:MAG: hypothetical protein ACREC3_06830 [Methyloceanibacter sp.]